MFPFLVFEISQPPLTLLIVSILGFMRKATHSHPLCAWLTRALLEDGWAEPFSWSLPLPLSIGIVLSWGAASENNPTLLVLRTVSTTPAPLDKGFQFHLCVVCFSCYIHFQSGVLACICDWNPDTWFPLSRVNSSSGLFSFSSPRALRPSLLPKRWGMWSL